MHDPYRGDERELVPGAIRGYRVWRAWQPTPFHDAALYATNWYVRWTPGRNAAVCQRDFDWGQSHISVTTTRNCRCPACNPERGMVESVHQAPLRHCFCGFYARYQPDYFDYRGNVGGIIKAYGHVVLGTEGFRAQYAEIEALFPLYPWHEPDPFLRLAYSQSELAKVSRNVPRIAAGYKVPYFNSLQESVEALPPIPVTEILNAASPVIQEAAAKDKGSSWGNDLS